MAKKDTPVPEPQSKVEKKLEKLTDQNKKLREENRELRGEVTKLERGLADAAQSEDFIRLKELHTQLEQLKGWKREIKLPFGKVNFSFSYGRLNLDIDGQPKEMASYGIHESEMCQLKDFCTAINEAIEKQEEMEQLKLRLNPLKTMIMETSKIIVGERQQL